MTIDSHVHFWKFDRKRDAWITDEMKVLQQDYLPEHLSLTLKRNEIDGVVAIQASQEEVETRFLVRTCQNTSIHKRRALAGSISRPITWKKDCSIFRNTPGSKVTAISHRANRMISSSPQTSSVASAHCSPSTIHMTF